MLYIYSIGLVLIVIGLLVQLIMNLVKKNKDINEAFLLLYAIGAVILAVGNFADKHMGRGTLNAIAAILALIIAIIIITRKK